MSCDSIALVHHPDFLRYDFGPQHPLRPERISVSLDLLEAARLWNPRTETLTPGPATVSELELVHDPAYVKCVEESSHGLIPARGAERHGLSSADNPAFEGMHEAAAMVTGGTVAAARSIMNGDLIHAFNPAGGLHHATRERASGFCIYNDPAVAAAVLVKEYGARVLYIDLDCHHGDGVQWIFYDNPNVLTVSYHESGRFLFPGTGEVNEVGQGAGLGYSVNIPMQPFTQDESWLSALRALLPDLAERFRPDFVLSNHGCDTHVWDPLTHLSLSTASFVAQARLAHELAHTHASGRWLAVGSGGYDWRRVVPRSWAIVWAEMTGRSLPERLPVEWLRRWAGTVKEALPTEFLDGVDVARDNPQMADIDLQNQSSVDRMIELLQLVAGQ